MPDDRIRIRPFSSGDYESVIDVWRADGATKVNLLVEPENISAAQSYEGLGYSGVRFTLVGRLAST